MPNVSNRFVVRAPGVPLVTETIYRVFGSGAKCKAAVSWTASPDAQVKRYDLQWKKRGDVAWQQQTGLTALNAEILDVDADEYLIRVRGISDLSVESLWAQRQITFTGLSDPPAPVTWFVIDGDTLSWQAPNDLDVAGYLLRFHYGLNTSWGDANALHGGLITESPFQLVPRPAGQVTIMIKPVDALGTESATSAYIVADLGATPVANVVQTINLGALGWPGTVYQGAVSGGAVLANDASGLAWSDNADTAGWTYDSAAGWDASVWFDMVYTAEVWPTLAGLGSALTLSHTISGPAYGIEYRRQAPAAGWTLDTEFGWTADADAGWSTADSWQPWPGAITALNEPYDVRVSTALGAPRATIGAMVFSVDMPNIEEHFSNVVIAAGGTRLPITRSYRAITTVTVTVQNDGNGGIGERVMDKNAVLGPQLKVYDAAGSAVTGLIDSTLRGY